MSEVASLLESYYRTAQTVVSEHLVLSNPQTTNYLSISVLILLFKRGIWLLSPLVTFLCLYFIFKCSALCLPQQLADKLAQTSIFVYYISTINTSRTGTSTNRLTLLPDLLAASRSRS